MTTTDHDLRSAADPNSGNGVGRIVAVHIGTLVVFVGVAFAAGRLSSPGKNEWVLVAAFMFLTGLASAQAAMLGAVAASSGRTILFRLRWFFRLLLVQWICLTLPVLGSVEHWNYPLSIFLDQLLVCVPSFLVAGLVRLLSHRVLVHKSNPDRSSHERNQFSVADLLVLMTCVAIVFGVIRLFPQKATGWDPLTYAVMIAGGIVIGIPTGVIVPLLTWGFFTERDRPAEICRRWWIGLMGVAIVGIPLFAIIGAVGNSDDSKAWAYFFFIVLTALSATFITAIAFRKQGYRFQRRTKPAVTLSSPDAADGPISARRILDRGPQVQRFARRVFLGRRRRNPGKTGSFNRKLSFYWRRNSQTHFDPFFPCLIPIGPA